MYKVFYNYRGFDIWEVFKDYVLSKLICNNYTVYRPIAEGKSGNKIY